MVQLSALPAREPGGESLVPAVVVVVVVQEVALIPRTGTTGGKDPFRPESDATSQCSAEACLWDTTCTESLS